LGSPAACFQRGKGGVRGGVRGLYRGEHWWPVMAPVTPGVTPASVTGRGRERSGNGGDDRRVPPVGERERRGKGAGLFRGRLGRLAPGCGPVGFWPLFYLFFFSCFLSLLFLKSVWVFERVLPFKFE
jgi:hypothetical protein